MTALAGYWSFGRGGDPAGACARMLRGQSIYGREDAAWSGDGIAIGRRIFRRLPEDQHDRAPAVGAGGRLAVVADIRIDNRAEIASGLGLSAADAARLSDSALLLRAWERWEEDTLQRLHGDYAFALWDSGRRTLTLARDAMGRQPLFWHRGDGFFAFASMPKGLHALPEIPMEADGERVADFLGVIHNIGPGSFFRGIDRVEMGHVLAVTPEAERTRKYWQPSLAPLRFAKSQDYVEALREQFDRAVAARLRGGEKGAASHLSAGLDSAGVAATAARLLAPARLVAYTAAPAPGARLLGPRGSIADEFEGAAKTAALYPNIDHVRIETGGRSPLATLDRNVFLYDRPRLNLVNGLWLDAIKDDARARGLSVLLTGQLGNLTMSYSGEHYLPELLGRFRLLRLAREAWALKRGGMRLGTLASSALGPFLPRRLWTAIARARGRGGLAYHSAIRPEVGASEDFRRRAAEREVDLVHRPMRDGRAWRLRTLRRFDSGIENKGTLGGWGIDLRDPTADRALIEYCLRVPAGEFMRGGRQRALARRAFADRLPEEIVRSIRRGYQASDWPEGMEAARADLAEEIARCAALPEAAMLDTGRLQALLDDWPEEWSDPALIARYRIAGMRGVSAAHFIRKTAKTNA